MNPPSRRASLKRKALAEEPYAEPGLDAGAGVSKRIRRRGLHLGMHVLLHWCTVALLHCCTGVGRGSSCKCAARDALACAACYSSTARAPG